MTHFTTPISLLSQLIALIQAKLVEAFKTVTFQKQNKLYFYPDPPEVTVDFADFLCSGDNN
jgi:hypothetical protein